MSTTEDHKEVQVYELGYLVLPSIPEDGLSDVVNAISSIIKKEGATELDSEAPLKIDLAYTMSKVTGARKYVVQEAYIGWMKFEGEPEMAPKIKAGVEKLDEILRLLLIKAPKETTFTFAAALQAKLEAENPVEAPAEEAVVAPVEEIPAVIE